MRDDGSPCPHCGGTGPDGRPQWFCTNCGAQVVAPVSLAKFSFLVFLLLCLIMILPGVLYLLYYVIAGSKSGCPQCRQAALIPISSPIAQAAIANLK